jgi:hypothetical protein
LTPKSYSLFQRDLKLGKLSTDAYTQQALEILTALKKLGEPVPSSLLVTAVVAPLPIVLT